MQAQENYYLAMEKSEQLSRWDYHRPKEGTKQKGLRHTLVNEDYGQVDLEIGMQVQGMTPS